MSTSRGPADSPSNNGGTFASLRIPAYRTLWFGSLFSFMGVQMQFMLRGLLAWDLTEREGALGIVFMVFGLALLVSTPLGGVAADRLRKRRLMVVGQAILLVSSLLMGAAVLAGVEQFWMLLVAAVAQGMTFGLIGPARVSMTSELVGRDLLGNAVTLAGFSMSATRIFAPTLAATLAGVAAFGIGGAYIVAGVIALLSVVLTAMLPDLPPVSRGARSPLADIVDGVRFVAARPSLRRVLLTSTIVIMFGFNYVAFMPALVEGLFERSETYVGLMSTASSVGAVAASIALASRADSPAARRMILGFGLAFGATVVLLGLAPSFWLAVPVAVAVGGASTGYQSLTTAKALRESDDEHQGRVQSLMQLSFAGFGIAAAPLGLLAEAVGLRAAMAVMGLIPVAAVSIYGIREGLMHRPLLHEQAPSATEA